MCVEVVAQLLQKLKSTYYFEKISPFLGVALFEKISKNVDF